MPFSSLAADGDEDGTAVDVDRFAARRGTGRHRRRGVPEERLLAGETRARIEEAIEALPPNQRAVITLRDVEGLSAEEACNVWASPRPINVYCSTEPGRKCGPRWSGTWRMHERNGHERLPCQEIVELVTDYLEDAMDEPLRASFEAHLAGCPHCTHYLEQIEATIRVAGTIQRRGTLARSSAPGWSRRSASSAG